MKLTDKQGEALDSAVMLDPNTVSVWRLARLAGCADPDTFESPGADFLGRVLTMFLESIEYAEDLEALHETEHETADGAIPVYTYNLWKTFTDLGAWETDISEYMPFSTDTDDHMTRGAQTALFIIARNLLAELHLIVENAA